jgi:hypothetical protein
LGADPLTNICTEAESAWCATPADKKLILLNIECALGLTRGSIKETLAELKTNKLTA